MTLETDLRNGLVTVIQGITNSGMIYDHYKYSSDWQNFLDQFSWVNTEGKRQIRGWWLAIPTVRTGPMSTFDEPTDLYEWPIRGVMSFSDKDSSENAFGDLIYLVRRTLRRQTSLGLSGDLVIPGTIVVDIPTVDIRTFGSVLCHYTEIRLTMEVNVLNISYVA